MQTKHLAATLVNKIKTFWRRFTSREYRLTVYYKCNLRHFYGPDKATVVMLADISMPQWRAGVWTLYKTGPCFMAEREVDSNCPFPTFDKH